MRRLALILALVAAPAAAAQEFGVIETTPLAPIENTDPLGGDQLLPGQPGVSDDIRLEGNFNVIEPEPTGTPEIAVEVASAALLRGLDKVSGEVTDLELEAGETVQLGRISVTLQECRYPADNPSGDAFAFLKIDHANREDPAFEGWMIASSPALSAMDDPRYDVWVIRCNIS